MGAGQGTAVGRGWLLVAAFAVSSGGCSGTTFESRVNLTNVAPVKRLAVVDAARSPFFSGEVYRGFLVGLTQRLATCGVVASIGQLDELDADPARSVADEAKRFGAGAIMVVKAAGGRRSRSSGELQDKLRFQLVLQDLASGRRTWRAEATFNRTENIFTNEVEAGIGFATSIAERLRDDRVLPGCPSGKWPKIVVPR